MTRRRPWAWRVVGARHAGITVSDLSTARSSSTAARSGSSSLWRRRYEEPEIREIVGVPEATGVRHRDAADPRQRDPDRAARVPGLRAPLGRDEPGRLRHRPLLPLRRGHRRRSTPTSSARGVALPLAARPGRDDGRRRTAAARASTRSTPTGTSSSSTSAHPQRPDVTPRPPDAPGRPSGAARRAVPR